MRKKLVMSMMMIITVAAFITGSAVAAFMDVESSADNSFQAGSLDLKTNDVDGVTQTLYATNMKPGTSIGPATVILKNAGSIDAATLDVDISYTESDDVTNPVNMTADQVADELIVNQLKYGPTGFLTDLLSLVTDVDADGKDMKEVAATDFSGLAGINAGLTKDFVIQVTLKDDLTDNNFQADGVDINLTFTLNQ